MSKFRASNCAFRLKRADFGNLNFETQNQHKKLHQPVYFVFRNSNFKNSETVMPRNKVNIFRSTKSKWVRRGCLY